MRELGGAPGLQHLPEVAAADRSVPNHSYIIRNDHGSNRDNEDDIVYPTFCPCP